MCSRNMHNEILVLVPIKLFIQNIYMYSLSSYIKVKYQKTEIANLL